MFTEQVLGGILGFVVGDALGVPVEFESRSELKKNPVVGMMSCPIYDQPAGAWSDDSSMTLCTLESLSRGLDYEDMMSSFLRWANDAYMTPHGEVFDMGKTTREALMRYAVGNSALECGATSEYENGNGSLMRILPVAFYLYHKMGEMLATENDAYETIHTVSRLTHAHPISLISCGIYCAIAGHLLNGEVLVTAISNGISDAKGYYRNQPEFMPWLDLFSRVEKETLAILPEDEIQSDGYVLNTLEAALWCLIQTDAIKDCLLTAVNLGADTDTVAAVAGGLAGIYYGGEMIPHEWLAIIAKRDMIESLCRDFVKGISS